MNVTHHKGLIQKDLDDLTSQLRLRTQEQTSVSNNAHREFCRREVTRLQRWIGYLRHYKGLVERYNELPDWAQK